MFININGPIECCGIAELAGVVDARDTGDILEKVRQAQELSLGCLFATTIRGHGLYIDVDLYLEQAGFISPGTFRNPGYVNNTLTLWIRFLAS